MISNESLKLEWTIFLQGENLKVGAVTIDTGAQADFLRQILCLDPTTFLGGMWLKLGQDEANANINKQPKNLEIPDGKIILGIPPVPPVLFWQFMQTKGECLMFAQKGNWFFGHVF